LLLTDDGELARFLEHPSAKLRREYRVRVFGGVQANMVKQMRRGVTLRDGTKLQPMEVQVLPMGSKQQLGRSSQLGSGKQGDDLAASKDMEWTLQSKPAQGDWKRNTWMRMALVEGKNREIRRTMEHFGLTVSRLVRERYGPYELDGLDRGAVLQVPIRKDILRRAAEWTVLRSKGRQQNRKAPLPHAGVRSDNTAKSRMEQLGSKLQQEFRDANAPNRSNGGR